jgi:hypothetical protein
MTRRGSSSKVHLAFEPVSLSIPLSEIMPLREVGTTVKRSMKYAQIAASIVEVGVIEPPVVVRDAVDRNRFHLLDGHLRVEILQDLGRENVVCLVATDDEAFTYNRRVSRIAIVQEHKMILNAIKKGVSEERLARALNVDINSIRTKKRLLDGICPEVVDLVKDRHVPINTFAELKRMKPMRQIEAVELMIAMNRFSVPYAKTLTAATPQHLLISGERKSVKGLSSDQIGVIERESASLDREFKVIEADYGSDHLDLVLATGYVGRLLESVRAVRYLAQNHAEILSEFQRIADAQKSK